MDTSIDYELRHREVEKTTMDDEDSEPSIEHQRPPWTEKILYFLLPYLNSKRHIRVIYFTFVAIFLSLLKAGGEFFHVDVLTGRQSVLNQVFIKLGMGWTLIIVILLRGCCLPLHSNWKQHLWNLLLRVSTVTFFYYFWCQVVFPIAEEWTGRCVRQNIVINMTDITKKHCLNLEDHVFYSVDISGHSFLMPYCILIIMEESKELIYILCLGEFLRRSGQFSPATFPEEHKPAGASSFPAEELLFLQKKYGIVIVCILVTAVLASCLSLIWDLSFLVTTLYYHSFTEKALGASIAIGTWYIEYPLLFNSLTIL